MSAAPSVHTTIPIVRGDDGRESLALHSERPIVWGADGIHIGYRLADGNCVGIKKFEQLTVELQNNQDVVSADLAKESAHTCLSLKELYAVKSFLQEVEKRRRSDQAMRDWAFNPCRAGRDPAVPDLIKIIPWGYTTGVDGHSQTCNSLSAEMIRQQLRQGRKILVDCEHWSVNSDYASRAPHVIYGEVLEVFPRPDLHGLYGLIHWNAVGRAALRVKMFSHTSPALEHADGSDRVIGLHSVALTNDPALNLRTIWEEAA